MVEHIPPAFRKRRPSYTGLDDAQVLNIAAAALMSAHRLPAGSKSRASQWAKFDDAMGELSGRGMRHMLAKIREHEENGDEVPESLSYLAHKDALPGEVERDGE